MKVLVEEHAKSVVGTVVRMVAKETAEEHVLVLAESLVLEGVLAIAGACQANAKRCRWCHPVFWHQPTLFNKFTSNGYYQ